MKFIADFHIHSKYSRATSLRSDLESFGKKAIEKGILVIGTGDFTHPLWLKEIKDKLEPAESGLFQLKDSLTQTRFILTSEISCIYSKNGGVRKVHILVICPSIENVEKINARLNLIGNLKSDGRPILGLDAKELAKIVFNVSEDNLVIPAHAWTPWFGIFGSKSGFDSLEECFEELTPQIFSIETGLSSDPPMNWQISALDRITLISNSDAHSPEKLGREANAFDTELSYQGMVSAIKNKDKEKFLYTIEFYPEEGKYHFDGHRLCNISLNPEESKKYNNTCPTCGKPLTLGVVNRVNQLADRKPGFHPDNAIPFKSIIPLEEVIADALSLNTGTKEVLKNYNQLIQDFGTEFNILLNVSEKDLLAKTQEEIAQAIIRARSGQVYIEPGYDGVFGKIKVFPEGEERKHNIKQETLFQ
jgi:uncharacterized protein (TIGR00375 family)